MAESILLSLANSLVGKFATTVYEEASRALGVYDDFRALRDTLSIIKDVLVVAEQKQEQNPGIREWLKQIKIVFSNAEDLIDEFDCEAIRKQVVKDHGSTMMKVDRFFSSSNPLVFRREMARQIQELRERLDRLAADRIKYGLEKNGNDSGYDAGHKRETYSVPSLSHVKGRNKDKMKIVEFLLQSSSGPSVMPIVGIEGLGKTTLAKLVFDDAQIKARFELRMWVNVSDGFDSTRAMQRMMEYASDSITGGNKNNVLHMNQIQSSRLRDMLAIHRFLLVLDDVWKIDHAEWIKFRSLLEGGAEGSKMIVTTHDNSIALMMGTVPSHMLAGLSQEDSLSLLATWAMVGNSKSDLKLKDIGKGIVEKCSGVPLAVRTAASYLHLRREEVEWKYARDNNEIWNVGECKEGILAAIKLSLDRLPSYLRRCFPILLLYPRGSQIDSQSVTALWMALGLLQSHSQVEGRDLEDVGRQYVQELYSKSFLQDFRQHGQNYFFRVHDLVQSLGMHLADDFQIVTCRTKDIPEGIQHLSLVEKDLAEAIFLPKSPNVRTILFPVRGVGADSEALLDPWLSKFKYLRVLDLSDSSYKTLPSSIGESKHLRYLNLSNNTEIKKLPSFICQLQSLQTLLLSGCKALETLPLPERLRMLISLRHLDIRGCPELYRKYQPQVGQCWGHISHIPRVSITESREEIISEIMD